MPCGRPKLLFVFRLRVTANSFSSSTSHHEKLALFSSSVKIIMYIQFFPVPLLIFDMLMPLFCDGDFHHHEKLALLKYFDKMAEVNLNV